VPGKGWFTALRLYNPLEAFFDKSWQIGEIELIDLDGAKNYRLRVPAKLPVKRFWAVTAYDPLSRSLLGSDGPITVGSLGKPDVNDDGSVDVYFGAEAPEGKEKNWIKTDPSKGFFVVFRFYSPLGGFIDETWVLNDIELVK